MAPGRRRVRPFDPLDEAEFAAVPADTTEEWLRTGTAFPPPFSVAALQLLDRETAVRGGLPEHA
jgi:hypothetical protein